ncbi:Mysoin-binding motif of peroxisomes-domain-containing protein [Lipomyces chichibuensis]|uniref:Mysoin-binding motif of peroxisomes-domain-containing protein n=1 Tax=Lipomyces chichibuensis TaxID=1546026 RepID=UPI00334354E7
MVSEHVVYNDSPLGEYLKAAGEDVATATELAEEWDPSAERPTKFARFAPSGVKHPSISNSSGPATVGHATRRTAVFHGSNTELKPLALGNERSMRKLRFQFLFAAPLKRRLSPRENSRFLERFRYVLVTSQLLDENVPISAFGRSDDNEGNLDSDFSDERNLKSKKGTRSDLGTGTKYWVGSGGCIVVVAVLFAWFFRGCDRLISGVSTKCKLLVGMVIGLLVSLFYYSHAWRKRLRTTRKTAIDCAAQFIKSNHLFDINMSRTIGIVQEVEFIYRGFGIPGMPPSASSSPLHGAFNRKSSSSSKLLHRKSSVGLRGCKALRNQISSALNLSLSLYRRSLDGLSELCNHSDLEKYFEIYDFNSPTAMQLEKEDQRRNNESPDVIDNGEDEDDDEIASIESIWGLKQQFRRLHHTRRKLLCCLLAMDAHGDGSDFKKWRSVVQDLKTLSDLMKQLSDDLGQSLLQSDITELVEFYRKEQESQNQQQELQRKRHPHKSVPSSQVPIQVNWRPHLQALNTISATLRNIEAKMYVLREDSARLELQDLRISASPNKTPERGTINMDSFLRRSGSGVGSTMDYSASPSLQTSSDILVKQYNSIGADLKALVKEWESGKGKLYEAIAASGACSSGPSTFDRLYDIDNDSSPVSSVMSSPDSLLSGTTFDSPSIPWSPQGFDEGRFLMRDLEDEGDDDREGDGSGLVLERDSGGIPMAAKSKMVENIASAMIRQQDRMLRSL